MGLSHWSLTLYPLAGEAGGCFQRRGGLPEGRGGEPDVVRAMEEAVREFDGLTWLHYDGLIWPHPRPIASQAFGLSEARAGGRREDGIEGGAVRVDP